MRQVLLRRTKLAWVVPRGDSEILGRSSMQGMIDQRKRKSELTSRSKSSSWQLEKSASLAD
jgi:hypothetical protein